VIAENGSSELVEAARKYLKNPYRAE